MPQKRPRLMPLLLPAIVCVPLGGLLVFLLVSSWHAADAQAAVTARLSDTARMVSRDLDAAVEHQKAATDLLSRSPMVWLWVKFQGAKLTASNRSHAETAWQEIENYGRLVPGSVLQLGSENTRTLYRDGAPIRSLAREEAATSWYHAALKTEGVSLSSEAGSIRTTSRILDGARVLGAVSCVVDAASLAASVLPEGAADRGMSIALTDAAGEVARAVGVGSAGAKTIFDLHPGASRDRIRAALDAMARTDVVTWFTWAEGAHSARMAAARTAVPGWYLFVSSELPAALPGARVALLVGVPAAALALLLLGFILVALPRIRATTALLDLLAKERDASRAALRDAGAAAERAGAAGNRLASLASELVKEAASATQAGAEASGLLTRAEDRDAELRAGLAGRATLLERIAAAARNAPARSAASQSAAGEAGSSGAKAEEDLSRVITSGASASRAFDRAAKAIGAIVEGAERMRLLSMNAALEAVRAGGPGKGFARVADEIRGLADNAAARAAPLVALLAELGRTVEDSMKAAQEAGRTVHAASSAAQEGAKAIDSAWGEVSALLDQAGKAAASAMQAKDLAAQSDRGRSSLEGISRIAARITAISAEIQVLAARALSETEKAVRAAIAEVGKEKT